MDVPIIEIDVSTMSITEKWIVLPSKMVFINIKINNHFSFPSAIYNGLIFFYFLNDHIPLKKYIYIVHISIKYKRSHVLLLLST